MRERASGERDAADRVSIRQPADLGDDAAAAEIGQESPDTAKLEVAPATARWLVFHAAAWGRHAAVAKPMPEPTPESIGFIHAENAIADSSVRRPSQLLILL
jgi:hypothetical protein